MEYSKKKCTYFFGSLPYYFMLYFFQYKKERTYHMKRIYQADFIRTISTLGIFCFHFWSKSATNHLVSFTLPSLPNFTLGSLFVTVFFMLSGAMLYYTTHRKPFSITHFYWRRFLGVFPAFYLSFFPLHLKTALEYGTFFYKGNPKVFFLSLLGMDGYLSYRISTYYQVGEWFLGALILLYVLYPLLYSSIKQHTLSASVIILLLYSSTFSKTLFQINSFQNLFSCLLSFWLGMLLMKYQAYFLENRKFGWSCGLFLLLLLFVQLPLNTNILAHIGGFACFCFLYTIAPYFSSKNFFRNFFCTCSTLSYPFYLVHHVILSVILNRIQGPMPWGRLVIFFFITLAITLATALVLHIILTCIEKKFLNASKELPN